jgi:type III secretion control protein HpaP
VSRKALTFAEVMARQSSAKVRPPPEHRPDDEARKPSADALNNERQAVSLAVELGSRLAEAQRPPSSSNADSSQAHEAAAQGDGPALRAAGAAREPAALARDDAKAARHSADAPGRPQGEPAVAHADDDDVAPLGDGTGEAVAGAAPVAVASLEHDADVVRYLAETAARFCSDPAVAKGEGWQVQMALDPEILRDTTLHLSLSPHWLTLRFVSADQRARGLVSEHQEALEQTLGETLVPRREIAITVE